MAPTDLRNRRVTLRVLADQSILEVFVGTDADDHRPLLPRRRGAAVDRLGTRRQRPHDDARLADGRRAARSKPVGSRHDTATSGHGCSRDDLRPAWCV
ncbi:hypothetical protein AB5I41_07450 [Sphingomonas sp. MMS24-JH45]